MVIGLLGFEFESSNKGCEALTYSLFPILEKADRNCTVIVFNIHDSLGEIPVLYPGFTCKNVKIEFKKPSFWKEFKKNLKQCDVVLDITHGDSFSDIYGTKWLFKTTYLKSRVIKSKTPLILMPQTYGPFNGRLAKAWAKKIIKRSHKIYTRDSRSKDYLINEMGIAPEEIFNTSDLAFSLPYEKVQTASETVRVGINISGLLWTQKDMKNNKISLTVDYKEYCERLVTRLENNKDYSVYLIPHVICDEREGNDYYDNDCAPAKAIQKAHPDCIYRSDFKTAVDVKNYIAAMDILVASRMHASIGAYSAGICSIPFAYSRKFAGVYDDLGYKYLIDGTKMNTEEAVDKTIDYIKQYRLIREESHKGMELIGKQHDEFVADLISVMEDIV